MPTSYSPWAFATTLSEEAPTPVFPAVRATFRLEALLGASGGGGGSGGDTRVTTDGDTRVTTDGDIRVTAGSGGGGGSPAEGGWVDLTTDVLVEAGVQWRRGISGAGLEDRVADTGVLTFSLFNDTYYGNPRGYYSPNHANVRDGWAIDVPIRLIAVFDGDDYPLWRGFLSSVLPLPGTQGRRCVICTAVDAMEYWHSTPVQGVTLVEDASIENLVQAISDESDEPLWIDDPDDGELVDLDTSSDRLPFAFLGEQGEVFAVTLLQNVMQSALGYAYVAKDGTFTTENRHRRPLRSSVLTLDDEAGTLPAVDDAVVVPSDLEGVFNRLRVTAHEITPGDDPLTVLFRSPAVLYVEPGDTVTFWGPYGSSDNTTIVGGRHVILPIEPGTDYAGNSAADGTGSDLTADLSIVTYDLSITAQFVVTNNGASRVYLVDSTGMGFLQVRGQALYDNGPTTVEASDTAPYRDRVETLDLRYLSDVAFARSYGHYLVSQYVDPVQTRGVAVDPQVSDTQMIAALGLEIGDVVTVSETMTGLDEVEAYVQAISGEFRDNFWITMRLGLAPRQSIGAAWTLGTSVLGTSTTLGF